MSRHNDSVAKQKLFKTMTWPEQFQSVNALPAFGCAAGAYALGCFATGYYFVRFKTGQDIREIGSGSIGSKNVGRLLGRGAFWLTALGDGAKGALAVLGAQYFTDSNAFAALAMLFVVIGHIWPAPLHWRGGKGVVTSGGAMAVFDFQIALAYGAAFLLGFVFIRKRTMPGLLAYLVIPFASHLLHHSHIDTALVTMLAGLILFAHRQNFVEEFPALARWREMPDKPQHTKP